MAARFSTPLFFFVLLLASVDDGAPDGRLAASRVALYNGSIVSLLTVIFIALSRAVVESIVELSLEHFEGY